MAAAKHQKKKTEDFAKRKVKTDHEAIKRNRQSDDRALAQPVEDYHPLFAKLKQDFPPKNYRIED